MKPFCSIAVCLLIASFGRAADFEPGDPLVAVDGDAVYLGELNLILTERLKARDLERVPADVQKATAVLLVRRHLAMKTLREQGGDSLQAVIDRQLASFTAEAKRRGSSLEAQAKSRQADVKSLKADLAWRTAWAQYLKSRLTEKNLRLFFEKQADKYGAGKWEVSQIFVKMNTNDAPSVEATYSQMQELAGDIRDSGSVAAAFARAAMEHSDGGTASDGGKVGWVSKDGDLPSAVMAVVRTTQVGELSKPIRSPLGMHLVFVHQAEKNQIAFDDLADQSQLRRDASNALFDALIARQKDAKVTWFINSLRPPPEISILP